MYNPMMNPNAGQERVNELIAEAEKVRRNRKLGKKRNVAAQLRALFVKSLGAVIR